MFHGGTEGLRRIMSQDTLKPRRLGDTLGRFGAYFKPYWLILILAGLLVIGATWAQVTAPELLGQAVDCYFTPTAASAIGNLPGATEMAATSSSLSNCTYADNVTSLTAEEKLAGFGGLILRIIGLYIMTSLLTGLTFYLMSWAGQHVLRQMRVDLFRHLHRLSIGYFAEHEVGDMMSRITNDSDTIQQAFSFALINVLSGLLLLGWIANNMLVKSVPYALLSLSVVPLMVVATVWFSSQARKAFRRTRLQMGSVSTELQETISSVREVQAFSREQENIQNFMETNAANRDANIRALDQYSERHRGRRAHLQPFGC